MPSNSSSSTGSSSSSSSSSSMGCPCTTFQCDGPGCAHFTTWMLNGVNEGNSNNCTLYVLFDVLVVAQQVELYKDSLYSDLVAIGQMNIGDGPGTMVLTERNASGINGSVYWDAKFVFYPSATLISCYDLSSSSSISSTSSLDSHSTSSESPQSVSSSSSNCCVNPVCEGDGCSHFSTWTLNGNNDGNTDNCTLYVVFEYIAANQQVRLYKGSAYADLVASGQAAWLGIVTTITLAAKNGSGLSGSVIWVDGVPVNFPSYAVLDCEISSSSSGSSSSDSSSSNSSSSHSSFSSGTSYSTSSQSSSSSSSSSESSTESLSSSSTSSSGSSSSNSSSSSSVDSNSSSTSSSESAGNISTSSSESLGFWNKSKPLLLATAAISSIGTNQLAQTIYVDEDFYSIGKVYCYFYGPFGFNTSYTIHLDIYTCSDSGSPSVLIFSGIPESSVTENGWYSFLVEISGTTPNNHYLSFVIWQQGGTENDYVLWGYNSTSDTVRTSAWISSDGGGTWSEQEDIVRALKVVGSFNAYDLTNYRILTPAAEKEVFVQDLTGGTHDGTKLVSSSYPYGMDKVVIDYPNAIASFVIDSSGSMGWNDRTNTRSEIVTSIIQKFKNDYPSNVIFDIVKFGAQSVNASSVTTMMGSPQYINLDLNSPTRKPFTFTVSNANASKNAIYTNNSYSFTVTENIISGSSLICTGSSSADPYPSGTLTKASGIGDSSIDYTDFTISTYADGIVALGFRNFVDDHPYNIGSIAIGGTYQQEVTISGWQALEPNGETEFSVGSHGPKDTSTLDLIGDPDLVLRHPATVAPLATSKVLIDASVGSSNLYVEDTSLFISGNKVDFVDVDSCSLGHTITNVNSVTSSITVTPTTTAAISSWVNGGGIIQDSNFDSPANITGTTIQLLVRDVLKDTGQILTFFIQTLDGLFIEWDFDPFKEWVVYNLYWLGDTAILPVSLYDTSGNPLPDGLEVQFSTEEFPKEPNEISASLLSRNASVGATKIYVQSTTGYARNLEIDILNNIGDVQTLTITEVGTDVGGSYIEFTPALLYDFTTASESKIIKSITAEDQTNNTSTISGTDLLSASLGLVDVTPIVTGKSLDPSLLKPFDVTPVAPSTTYDELNLDLERIRTITIDVPTIDGQAAVRILPITEDNLKTVAEKNEEASRLIFPERPPDYSDQLEQDSADLTTTTSSTTSTTTLMPSPDKDYTLESPVYSQNGLAESSMISYATNLTSKTFNISVPGISNSASVSTTLMVRSYDIYTSLVSKDSRGNEVARLQFKPFEVDFTPPMYVDSELLSGQIEYTTEDSGSDEDECIDPRKSYTLKSINGTYVGGEYRIRYTITDRNVLIQNGDLNIRIYSNTLVNIEEALATATQSTQELNVIYPSRDANVNGVITNVTPLSEIDEWRQFVENNPVGKIIESTGPSQDAESTGMAQYLAQKYAFAIGGITRSQQSEDQVYSPYSNPEQWTWATQYSAIYNITIPITAGHATLIIPASDISALLFIQASVYFGDNDQFEMIRSDLIYNGNPIDIGAIEPAEINAVGGSSTYEIGTRVTWNAATIANNVSVSFTPHDYKDFTPMLPSVSKTDNGWAGGVFIGPHAIVEMICPENYPACPCYGEAEDIDITVSYLGYQRTVTRSIYWYGFVPEEDLGDNIFYFYVPEQSTTTP